MKHLLQAKQELDALAAEKHGLALNGQLVVEKHGTNGSQEGTSSTGALDEVDRNGALVKVLPPCRVTKRGKPSAARDKPPYE